MILPVFQIQKQKISHHQRITINRPFHFPLSEPLSRKKIIRNWTVPPDFHQGLEDTETSSHHAHRAG